MKLDRPHISKQESHPFRLFLKLSFTALYSPIKFFIVRTRTRTNQSHMTQKPVLRGPRYSILRDIMYSSYFNLTWSPRSLESPAPNICKSAAFNTELLRSPRTGFIRLRTIKKTSTPVLGALVELLNCIFNQLTPLEPQSFHSIGFLF